MNFSEDFFYKGLAYCIIFGPIIFVVSIPIVLIMLNNKQSKTIENETKKYNEIQKTEEYRRIVEIVNVSYKSYVHLATSLNTNSDNPNYYVTVKQSSQTVEKEYVISSNNKSQFLYECSANIVQSASKSPFPYLCKYFNIGYSEESVKILSNLLTLTNERSAYYKNCYRDKKINRVIKINKTTGDAKVHIIHTDLSNIITSLNKLNRKSKQIKMSSEVVIQDNSCLQKKSNYKANYTFYYESTQGNSNTSCEIELTPENIQGLIAHIQAEIEHKQSKEQQRSLMTNELRTAIKQRDNYTCCNCGNSILNEPNLLLEVDHIIPISKGGQTEYYNLQTLCWRCNRSKSDKVY